MYVLLIVGGLYAWLRLPSWLGYVGSWAMTKFVLYNIPIGFDSVRVRPWLELFPKPTLLGKSHSFRRAFFSQTSLF